ncbi:hypothetical protein PENSUB_8232 [Penicillium subrubescens]|uniref:Uncharacterized protein n=1 Tax=Penicillium subrubescens TaxID=1316194 RepID=A0A1Q5TIJ1_9EURO|nr:hypothetical protein PENSUB_8232 [Penicillium subrubescens]
MNFVNLLLKVTLKVTSQGPAKPSLSALSISGQRSFSRPPAPPMSRYHGGCPFTFCFLLDPEENPEKPHKVSPDRLRELRDDLLSSPDFIRARLP